MEYGKLAGNTSINRKIHECLDLISKDDARAFVRRFSKRAADQSRAMHDFGELLVGAYLRRSGFQALHERIVAAKTPDWCIVDDSGGAEALVEVVTFHVARKTEVGMWRAFARNTTWVGCLGSNAPRLYDAIQGKFAKYSTLAEEQRLPYVVGVHPEFIAGVDQNDIERCLFERKTGLFGLYPAVSGLLYFEDQGNDYWFTFIANPDARRAYRIPNGVL